MTKKEIRQAFKQKRAELNDDQRGQFSAGIAAQLLNGFDLQGKHISIFLPIERFQEIETRIIIKHLSATFYLPVVKKDKLIHIRLDEQDQIKVSDWGIPEPTYGVEVQPTLFNAVLVPLLAVDNKGNRVGYEAGFYDGFLKQCSPNCTFIGLSYFDPIEPFDEVHSGDVPLNYCVTPNSVQSF